MAAVILSSKGGKRHKRFSPRLDMTPMVDLAFLLLTFFMLTRVFTDPYIMKIEMPEKVTDPPPVNDERVLTLILGEHNKVYWYVGITDPKVEVTSFSKEGIRKVLLEKNKEIVKMVVLIKPSDKSKYKNVVDIMDEISIASIERYVLVKITPQDEALMKKADQ